MTTVDNPKVSQTSGKDEDPKEKGFFNRPRAGGKTIWDWMQLLIIPFVLVIVGSFFSYQQSQTSLQVSQKQHEADQQQALDQQQAVTLQTYTDNIQDLLLNHKLLQSTVFDEISVLARARTLTAIRSLDTQRKSLLLNFLYEAGLIVKRPELKPSFPVISLRGADLSNVNLSNTSLSGISIFGANLSNANFRNDNLGDAFLTSNDLSGADLSRTFLIGTILIFSNLSDANLYNANLSDANLYDVNLSDVDLKEANLYDANLSSANLSSANFDGAYLTDANLNGAYLNGADLRGAKNLSQDQLDQVYSCKNAILPPGLTCHHNQ